MTHNVKIEAAPEVIARAGGEYRLKRYILVALMLAIGLWCMYDGFFKWPRYREEFARATPAQQALMVQPETDAALLINKVLAIGLISLSPLMLAFFLYNSRGEIRLAGGTLTAPGHPPVPLKQVVQLDKTKWDRKGIAYARYELGNSIKGKIRLDDFVYQYEPIHQIVDLIDADMGVPPKALGFPVEKSDGNA
ncbi:MAG TPA: hypothetical protein VH370_22005 [Humisphaera sp.]|nr:hypothetical protein [Humisphaera sp.]